MCEEYPNKNTVDKLKGKTVQRDERGHRSGRP